MNKKIGKTLLGLGALVGARHLAKTISHFDASDVLHRMGLERRHSGTSRAASSIGLIALGALAGAGLALMFAPSSGPVLRSRISHRLDAAKQRLQDRLHEESNSLEHAG